jgi:SagB-type dehydrogenase family enzyme
MHTAFQVIRKYHHATKHHFHRYARSAGMDWANQPNPFRFYEDTSRVTLPLGDTRSGTQYRALFEPPAAPRPLNITTLSCFLRFSLGLSAWKAAGASRWSLRMNPSSGNLHPTESHVVLPEMAGLESGLYHYSPFWHALELRAPCAPHIRQPLEQYMDIPGFLVALTSIIWRESWKYGERAYRYCNLDAGHALAALALAARLNHWRLLPLSDAGDDQIRTLLGLDRIAWPQLEAEEPDLLCWVCTEKSSSQPPRNLPPDVLQPFRRTVLQGRPNRLSGKVRDWPIIGEVAVAAEKPVTAHGAPALRHMQSLFPPPNLSAQAVIQRRRSGIDFDRHASIPAATFYSILTRTLPDADAAPFEAAPASPRANLLLFVHRVEAVTPGLYLLGRAADQVDRLRPLCRSDFEWQPAQADLPLWRLSAGDLTFEAMTLSCHQEIAAHGVFSVAMLVPFRSVLEHEPYLYRHLFWECGMIGQVLYLEAEAHGLRGTGIGCYFDDPVHELLGLADDHFQCFYHFTIGYAVEDPRLTTLPGYHHLEHPPVTGEHMREFF